MGERWCGSHTCHCQGSSKLRKVDRSFVDTEAFASLPLCRHWRCRRGPEYPRTVSQSLATIERSHVLCSIHDLSREDDEGLSRKHSRRRWLLQHCKPIFCSIPDLRCHKRHYTSTAARHKKDLGLPVVRSVGHLLISVDIASAGVWYTFNLLLILNSLFDSFCVRALNNNILDHSLASNSRRESSAT